MALPDLGSAKLDGRHAMRNERVDWEAYFIMADLFAAREMKLKRRLL